MCLPDTMRMVDEGSIPFRITKTEQMNMYTRTVHLDNHMSEVLQDRARQEGKFFEKIHGPRREWKMTKEESHKVRGPQMTLYRAAAYFRAHYHSEDIHELLMTGVEAWGASKEDIRRFRSHLPGGIKLVLDTPAPVVNKRRKRSVKTK